MNSTVKKAKNKGAPPPFTAQPSVGSLSAKNSSIYTSSFSKSKRLQNSSFLAFSHKMSKSEAEKLRNCLNTAPKTVKRLITNKSSESLFF